MILTIYALFISYHSNKSEFFVNLCNKTYYIQNPATKKKKKMVAGRWVDLKAC